MRLWLICACSVAALETTASWSFSGKWNSAGNNPTITSIYLNDDGSCDSSSGGYYYTELNHTFSTSGVRAINTYGVGFIGVVSNGAQYDLSNLCNYSSVYPLLRSDSIYIQTDSTDLYSYGHYFDANVAYTFIVGSSYSGMYVAEFWDGIQGQTVFGQNANRTWSPMTTSDNSCYQSGGMSLYDTQVVHVVNASAYNVFLAFTRNNASYYQTPDGGPTITILQGNVSGMDLSNATCASVNFVSASYDSSSLNTADFFVQLAGNQTYTFVISAGSMGDQSYNGRYSLTVTQAMYVPFGSSLITWTPPDKSSCAADSQCTTNSDFTALPFGKVSFQVPASSYFYYYASQPEDLEFYFYNGAYTPLTACGGPTSTCLIANDGGELAIYSPLSQWTLVAQAYSESATFGSNMSTYVYVMSGAPGGQMQTSAPTSSGSTTAPSSHGASAAPTSSRAPTLKGATYAPSSRAPTLVGATYAPSSMGTQPTASVNGAISVSPSLIALCSLLGFLSM